MKVGKLSLILPVYNEAKYLQEVLAKYVGEMKSLGSPYEIIIVNDGSTDGSRKIIAEYEIKFKLRGYDCVVIDQGNQGLAKSVSVGLMNITGD